MFLPTCWTALSNQLCFSGFSLNLDRSLLGLQTVTETAFKRGPHHSCLCVAMKMSFLCGRTPYGSPLPFSGTVALAWGPSLNLPVPRSVTVGFSRGRCASSRCCYCFSVKVFLIINPSPLACSCAD